MNKDIRAAMLGDHEAAPEASGGGYLMDIEKLVKGDIVRNRFAGENNPQRFLLYLGKGTIRQGRYSHKGYDCIAYDGKKVQLFRQNDQLIKVGHMNEYDTFVAALRRLKDG